jgi:hypothetical protein
MANATGEELPRPGRPVTGAAGKQQSRGAQLRLERRLQ